MRIVTPDHEVLIVLNAGDDGPFVLPEESWQQRIDTSADPVGCDHAVSGEIAIGWQSAAAFIKV